MVSPHLPASAAAVTDDRHEIFARTCVVAYWRCMSTRDRVDLWRRLDYGDPRLVGGTLIEQPAVHAGNRSELDRYIGVQDLVFAFEGRRVQEMVCSDVTRHCELQVRNIRPGLTYGWPMALMEMLVDPVLVE